jgi:predicted 3-demethylubiquinone-9 3-methyltransferase (glyoxalase superfamily)
MSRIQRIMPNLWFDHNAEDAANFYVSIFENSYINRIIRYGKAGYNVHGKEAGTVMTVEFTLDGQKFIGLNGGPHFHFNESISLIVNCINQDEIDFYWEKLSDEGDLYAQKCGWLKDKYGVSWQVVPEDLHDMLSDPDTEMVHHVMNELFKMKKIDIKTLKEAYELVV